MPYTQRAYNTFQMISYEIGALRGNMDNVDESKLTIDRTQIDTSNNRTYTADNYLPVSEQLPKDLRVRLKRMACVIHKANESIKANTLQTTLKIFMVPEFYFWVKNNKSNTYTADEKKQLVNALAGMFTHDDFTDWLFVPGSVVWREKASTYYGAFNNLEQGVAEAIAASDRTVALSTAMMIKGGEDGPHREIEKIHYSPDDKIQDDLKIDGLQFDNIKATDLMGRWDARRHSIFEIDGLDIGLEICKDHYYEFSVLKRTCIERAVRQMGNQILEPEPPKMLDLHFLIAATKELTEISVAAKTGGYVLKADGGRLASTHKSQVYKVNKQVTEDIELYMLKKAAADAANKDFSYRTFMRDNPNAITQVEQVKTSKENDGGYTVTNLEEDLQATGETNVMNKQTNLFEMQTVKYGRLAIQTNPVALPRANQAADQQNNNANAVGQQAAPQAAQ